MPDVPTETGSRGGDHPIPRRLAESVLATEERVASEQRLRDWFRSHGRNAFAEVRRVPLASLDEWEMTPDGILRHRSGKFFSVEGLDVHAPTHPVSHWSQPIINQPEVGVLGILVKEFDGVLHCLMQAKVEPGNSNGLQLSPTVQATRSNYTRVHGGKAVPYLGYFTEPARHCMIADVRQSEQGSAFYQKRNRNMVVETTDPVPVHDGFRWLTLGQVHRLLAVDDVVNMDARTVLSCLPFAGRGASPELFGDTGEFRAALLRSCVPQDDSRHGINDILSWITDIRSRTEVRTSRLPLHRLDRWSCTDEKISHDSDLFFSVIGVDVRAEGREVRRWMQPMIEPHGTGLVAFLVRPIDGVLHVLMHARMEPGYLDVVELAPTVQCTVANYAGLPDSARPVFLAEALYAHPERIRFDAMLSEEGGRFFHAHNRYVIVEADAAAELSHPNYRWLTVHQLATLLRHSHYLNVQARSLVACLHSLAGQPLRSKDGSP